MITKIFYHFSESWNLELFENTIDSQFKSGNDKILFGFVRLLLDLGLFIVNDWADGDFYGYMCPKTLS